MITQKNHSTTERINTPVSGYLMVVVELVLLGIGIIGGAGDVNVLFFLAVGAAVVFMPGFFIVNPNNAIVLLMFGEYKGTVKTNGFFWVNPLYSKENHEDRDWFAKMIPNFAYATKENLRRGVQLHEMQAVSEEFVEDLKKYKHKPNRISALLYEKVNVLYKEGKLTGDQLINVDKELKDFIDIMGGCERIRNTPIPYSYMMYIKKFIFIYIITLPFGFLTDSGYFTILIVLLVTFVLMSVELIAEEIEDPFGFDLNDLPTDELESKIPCAVNHTSPQPPPLPPPVVCGIGSEHKKQTQHDAQQ